MYLESVRELLNRMQGGDVALHDGHSGAGMRCPKLFRRGIASLDIAAGENELIATCCAE
jgi:hypothetical protein